MRMPAGAQPLVLRRAHASIKESREEQRHGYNTNEG